MINQLHSVLFRPEKGWDPVPAEHAALYSKQASDDFDEAVLDRLERETGPLKGKTVIDLGGGPGQYTVAFARRGAEVVWHDVSARYRDVARMRAESAGVLNRIEFSLGYMDEATRILGRTFDLVFNRVCFFYGKDDRSFCEEVFGLVKPGGFGYIDTHHSGFGRDTLSISARVRTVMNEKLGIKIGHPHPPRGRILSILSQYPIIRMSIDYSMPHNDRILFEKRA